MSWRPNDPQKNDFKMFQKKLFLYFILWSHCKLLFKWPSASAQLLVQLANYQKFKQGILKGKYHCTIDLLFDWFGISCMATDNFCFYLQNRLIQTSQTGGQWYSDTSPFSIPWFKGSNLPALANNPSGDRMFPDLNPVTAGSR